MIGRDGRPLPGHVEARQRRHGRRVRGRGHEARPPRRAQVPARRAGPGRGLSRALPARGPRRLRPQPPRHLHRPRDRRARGPALHRHGAPGRGDSRGADSERAVRARRPPRPRDPDRGRARVGPLEGHRPPRPQARQHLRDPSRAGQDPRLRPRQDRAGAAGGRRRALRGPDRDPAERAHDRGHHDGDGVLHVARAGARAADGRADRPLLAGHGALPDGHRRPALPGRDLGRRLRGHPQPRAPADHPARPRPARRARASPREGPREGPGPAVPERDRAQDGPPEASAEDRLGRQARRRARRGQERRPEGRRRSRSPSSTSSTFPGRRRTSTSATGSPRTSSRSSRRSRG